MESDRAKLKGETIGSTTESTAEALSVECSHFLAKNVYLHKRYLVVQFYPWFILSFVLYLLSYITIHKNKEK